MDFGSRMEIMRKRVQSHGSCRSMSLPGILEKRIEVLANKISVECVDYRSCC